MAYTGDKAFYVNKLGCGCNNFRECYILTNLCTNGSFEDSSGWGGMNRVTTYHYGSGSYCNQFNSGGTSLISLSIPTPVVGQKYYARRAIFTNGGNPSPGDCRFEIFGGDGAGLNYVFLWNNGVHSSWSVQSNLLTIDAVNASSYIIRSFTVNAACNVWTDEYMVINLTTAFGAGNEPTKEWCDAHIPFFTGTYELPCPEFKLYPGNAKAPGVTAASSGYKYLVEAPLLDEVNANSKPLSITSTKLLTNEFREHFCILKNLITDGSFEGSNWNLPSGSSLDTTHVKFGSKALKVTATTSNAEICITNKTSLPLNSTHIYYGCMYTYQEAAVGGCNIYWPIAEPSFGGASNGTAGRWNFHSWYVSRSSFSNGNHQMRIDFDNGYVAGTIWYDGIMIFDLTDAFGSGCEPTKEYMDYEVNNSFIDTTSLRIWV